MSKIKIGGVYKIFDDSSALDDILLNAKYDGVAEIDRDDAIASVWKDIEIRRLYERKFEDFIQNNIHHLPAISDDPQDWAKAFPKTRDLHTFTKPQINLLNIPKKIQLNDNEKIAKLEKYVKLLEMYYCYLFKILQILEKSLNKK